MTTLITDDFDDDCVVHSFDYDWEMEIIYGRDGWTDVSLSDEQIAALVGAGVIVKERTMAGPGLSVTLYRSLEGRLPDEQHS